MFYFSFKSKYRLNVHMDMHRSIKYRCQHCPMELSTRRTLRMHLLVHKEEKAYVCKVCSKAFRRSKDLKVSKTRVLFRSDGSLNILGISVKKTFQISFILRLREVRWKN